MMDTIELIPGLVFERISDTTSPPSSTLSFNSAPPGRSSLPGNLTRQPYHTNTLPSSRKNKPSTLLSPTSPSKKRATSPAQLPQQQSKPSKMEPRNDRGYYSLGSGVAKASRLMKSQNNKPNGGDYGVAVSIKGIKGHPFVILEDKENHRHMVAAPDPAESDNSSDQEVVTNGHTQTDSPSPTPVAPPRRSGQPKDYKNSNYKASNEPYHSPNTYHRPRTVNHQPVSSVNSTPPLNRQPGRVNPHSEQLVKPSEIKASQPKSSTLHMRSPRSRTSHERSQTLPRKDNRSRSMSPNRAMAYNKKNRSRSMSPPRKFKAKRVDDNNVQPVSSLIGFFETTPEHEISKTHPDKVPLIDRKRPASVPPKTKYSPYSSPASSNSTNTSTSQRSPQRSYNNRPKFESKEVDVTPDSLKKNLTITTATVPTKPGSVPAGRYFALTSPAATSRASKPFPQSSPRLAHLKSGKDDNSSHLSSSTGSSETGMTTDEGTLNILSDDHQNSPSHIYSRDLKPVANKPWDVKTREPVKRNTNRSGVLSEPLTKPSNTGQMYGEKAPWKDLPGYRPVNPALTKAQKEQIFNNVKQDYFVQTERVDISLVQNHNISSRKIVLTPPKGNKKPSQVKQDWRDLVAKVIEAEVVPKKVQEEKFEQKSMPKLKSASVSALASLLSLDGRLKEFSSRNRTPDKDFKRAGKIVIERIVAKTVEKPELSPNFDSVFEDTPRKPREDTKNTVPPKTVVSKAKIIGPSHQLLKKTKRKRNAQKVSTSNPNSRASSVCEDYSDFEYSDAESLGVSLRITDDEYDTKSKNSDSRPNSRHEYLLSPGSEHNYSGLKKSPSIVFEKISSQDTTKHPVETTQVDHDYLSPSHDPTVKELQENITELRKTVKELQQTADENLHNYDLLNDLERKLQQVEKERNNLEDEIVEGRKMLKDLERKLSNAQEEVFQLQNAEIRDRVTIQAQAKELEDMKNQLNEMDTELENQLSSQSDNDKTRENELAEKLSELQKDFDEMRTNQMKNEKLLRRKEDELAKAKQALKEESEGHDEEIDMMRKMHEDVLSRLRDELENLRQENISAVDARPLLEDQVSSLRNEVQRLKDHQDRRRHSSSSSSSSENSRRMNDDLLEDAREQLKQSHHEVEQLQDEIKDLQDKIYNLESNTSNSHYPVDKLYQDIDNLKQEKRSLEADLNSLEKQRSTLKGQVKSAQCDREEAERQVRDLESESSRLKGRIQELETEVERLKKELLRNRRNLEAQVCDLEHQMTESEQKMAGLHADKANLEKQLSEAKVTVDHPSLDTLLSDLHDLEQLKIYLEVQLENEKKLAETREEEIFDLMEELRKMSSASDTDDRNETLKQLEEFKEKTAKELEQVRLDVEGKSRLLREAERNNSKLQEELRRMDIELEEELNERESALAENSDLERKNYDLKTSMAQKNMEIEEKEREVEKLQNMLSLTEDSKLNLEEKLDVVENDKERITRSLHNIKEDIKDKDMEIEELKERIKAAKSSSIDDAKLGELEHENKMNKMQVHGLKQALEDKQNDLEDAEEKSRKLQSEIDDKESKMEETLRKLRDVEKQRRFAAKEAEDLTLLLSEKIADLDEAQRKLRRSESKMQDMEDASSLASNIRLELEKAKRAHAHELQRCKEEEEDANNALLASEKAVDQLQAELQIYEDRYQAAAIESMELERQRQNAVNKASEAQNELKEKEKALSKAEEKIDKLEKTLSEADNEAEDLSNHAQKAVGQKKEAELNCKNLESQLKEKEKELKDAEKKYDKLNDKLEKSGDNELEARKEHEEELRKAEDEADRAKQEVDLLKLRLAQEEDKCNDLEKKVDKLEELVNDQTRAEEESVLETNKLLRDLMEARKELDEKNKAFEQAQHLINNIENKIEQHESSNGKTADLMLQMQRHNDISENKILELEENLSRTLNDVEFAQVALKDTEDKMENAEKQVQELEKQLKEKENFLEDVENKANDLREEIQKKDDEKKKAEEKADSLQKQVEILQLGMKERSDWSDRKRVELEHEVEVLEVELRSSEDDLDKIVREKHELQKKIDDAEKLTKNGQKESDSAMRKELQQLRDSLDDKTQQVFAAEDTIYRQKEVIEELTSIQQATEKSSLEQMDSYMAESDKQFEQLKAHLQERNDQIKETQTEKEDLQKQMELLMEELEKATSDASRTRQVHEDESRRLDELEDLIKELRDRLKQEQNLNRELREKISASPHRHSPSSDEENIKQGDLEELTLRLHEEEDAKEEALSRLKSMGEQVNKLNTELDLVKEHNEKIKQNHENQKQEIEELRNGEKEAEVLKEKICTLEDKLQQEANELNAIDTHHRKTEMKLREILIQAEDETNKANSEKEMLAIRLQSLKQQLQDAEMEVNSSEEERRSLQEDLQEQREENYQLRQSLASLRPQAPAKSASGNLFTPV